MRHSTSPKVPYHEYFHAKTHLSTILNHKDAPLLVPLEDKTEEQGGEDYLKT